ncbi:MAG: sulfoxide reductase heme-binding subunit YedZ, partial [Granulosicoccus sp.]|nr:sulfoxide reductase heme-binding subunit YedZ [Granulosicoccus sp.]
AFTSTRKMVRRLGRRWSLLHRGVYLASTAAVIHYVWLAKGDLIEPYIYLTILLALLSFRLVRLMK